MERLVKDWVWPAYYVQFFIVEVETEKERMSLDW